jgi:hypothetical protein
VFPIPKPTNGNSPLTDDEPAPVDATRAAANEKASFVTRQCRSSNKGSQRSRINCSIVVVVVFTVENNVEDVVNK